MGEGPGAWQPGIWQIEELADPVPAGDVEGLANLLLDAIASGASVSFMAGLTREEAEAYWRGATQPRGRAIVLMARDAEGIAGTLSLKPAWAPNQPHRAEIAKVIVHRRARRQGLGEALMQEAEARARALGFTLLTLDCVRDGPGERLYRRLGWTEAGSIPGYSLDPSGNLCEVVYYYRPLAD